MGRSYGSSGGCVAPIITGDGYYEGALTGQGNPATPVVSIIADNGDGAIAGQNGIYYRLSVSLRANNVMGTYIGMSQGSAFPNGTQATSGSISAVASPNLNGTLTDQTGAAQSLAFNFDSVYNLSSSLATLAGTWSATAANGFDLTATIRPDGTFFCHGFKRLQLLRRLRLDRPKLQRIQRKLHPNVQRRKCHVHRIGDVLPIERQLRKRGHKNHGRRRYQRVLGRGSAVVFAWNRCGDPRTAATEETEFASLTPTVSEQRQKCGR